ncbi:MAG: hypothetical protein ABIA78_03475 [archaeon]
MNESSIKNSFRAVKGDIIELQGELLNLKEQHARILIELEKLSDPLKKLVKRKKK